MSFTFLLRNCSIRPGEGIVTIKTEEKWEDPNLDGWNMYRVIYVS
jgi:hypothetical protein